MTKKNLFINIAFLLIVIIFSAIPLCSCALSNKRKCYDPDCAVPISRAKTSMKYNSNERGILSFNINVDVTVYSKAAGNRTDLWGVEIKGKRGYAPKMFLREYKVFHNDLKHEVPTTQVSSDNNVSDEKLKPKVDNDRLKNGAAEVSNAQINNASDSDISYHVIDGTTVPLEHTEPTIKLTPVDEVVKGTTVVPNGQGAVDNLTASSENEKVKSNIFAKDDVLITRILKDKLETNGQSIRQKIDIKDYVISSEEILDVPEIAGVQVAPLGINVSSKDSVPNGVEKTTRSTESNKTPEAKGTETAKEVDNTNNSTESVTELQGQNTTDSIETVPIVDVKADTGTVQNNSKNSELENVKEERTETELKTEKTKSPDAPILKLEEQQTPENTLTKKEKTELKDDQTTSNTLSEGEKTESKDDRVPESTVIENEEVESKVDQTLENTLIKNEKIESKDNQTSENTLTGSEKTESKGDQVPENSVIENEKVESKDKQTPENTLIENENVESKDNQTSENTLTKNEKTELKDDQTTNNTLSEGEKTESKDDQVPENTVIENENVESKDNQTFENTLTENEKDESKDNQPIESILIGSEKTELKDDRVPENTVIKNEKVESEDNQTSEAITKNDNADNTVSSVFAQSTINNSAEVPLSTANNEGNRTEDILINNTEISGKPNLTAPLDSSEVEVISDATVSPVYPNAVQSPEETIVTTIISSEELQNDTVNNVHQVDKETSADILKNDINENTNLNNELNEFRMFKIAESDTESPELLDSNENVVAVNVVSSNEFRNRNLLNADIGEQFETESVVKDETVPSKDEAVSEYKNDATIDSEVLHEDSNTENIVPIKEVEVSPPEICTAENVECSAEDNTQNYFEGASETNEYPIMKGLQIESSYWSTLMYLSVTAIATLLFSLGYYYIENMRRDGQLIARINKLEKDLLVSTKECTILTENLKLTKDKLTSIEDESFGSNEMVLSLKADLEISQKVKAELEDQVAVLERDLEAATEAGLELERMLREVLSSDNEVNPLAQSVEDLQTRLNVQQAANESLTNALNLKTQENESLSTELVSFKRKCEELEVDLTQITETLKAEQSNKNSMEKTLTDKVQQLEMQIKEISTDKIALQKELKGKEVEIKDLMDVISRLNSNTLDFDKLYDVSHIKAEASILLEERNELKERLAEVEGAHSLLEEHMKVVKEEIATLNEQCKIAEKEKKDAETRLEVLSSFFEEKEAQRQKEEALWLQQQGEVVSTVERIQTMQSEIQNYKQQTEMLKREILDQEREYKNQMSVLETKAHEQWVVARQVERRLEESKVEAGQLRNRLTLIEKNINDIDPEAKLHRLEANGETTTSPPLFLRAESSSSPIMFSGPGNVPPPPPPSYLHSLFPAYLPPPLPNASGVPPYDSHVGQRPPPLGARLSSPPPMPLHPSSRYDSTGSPPPPMSPRLLPPYDHRSPPLPSFTSDHMHPPPPPPGSILPPPPLGTMHSWGEDSLPPPRNSGFHPSQRERIRNHKGSLHSSGESLDKTHHNSKV